MERKDNKSMMQAWADHLHNHYFSGLDQGRNLASDLAAYMLNFSDCKDVRFLTKRERLDQIGALEKNLLELEKELNKVADSEVYLDLDCMGDLSDGEVYRPLPSDWETEMTSDEIREFRINKKFVPLRIELAKLKLGIDEGKKRIGQKYDKETNEDKIKRQAIANHFVSSWELYTGEYPPIRSSRASEALEYIINQLNLDAKGAEYLIRNRVEELKKNNILPKPRKK